MVSFVKQIVNYDYFYTYRSESVGKEAAGCLAGEMKDH